ncbi:MAG: hypothetical protein KC422_19555 [Trueperaceae bacterium]|nr:hypothetical protein [Trueperaceae bacterium]
MLILALSCQSLAQEATVDEKIQNALSAGPAIIAEGARVMEWPGGTTPQEPGPELIELRPGSNGWTCIPNLLETPGNDPMCLNDIYLAVLTARVNKVDPPSTGIGIGYMLQEGTPKGSPPHMMVYVPGSYDGYAAYSTEPGPLPWIMFPDTPYAHLMITMVKGGE